MDLRPIPVEPSDEERRAVDSVLGAPHADFARLASEQPRAPRTQLLPSLLALQNHVGWISPGGLGYACSRLGLPPAEGFAVASFYALLALGERPGSFAHVCDDIACQVAGAPALCAELERELGPAFQPGHRAEPGAARPPSMSRWGHSPCLGLCEQAPAALVTSAHPSVPRAQAFGAATCASIQRALDGGEVEPEACHLDSSGPRRLLARAGRIDPTSIDAYLAQGGFAALQRAFEIGAQGVLREINTSKLVGRGGAAFPTGRKWEAVARAAALPHFVVCNADESEPGTFKDRVLLEADPFAVLEAMLVAGFATHSSRGYLYLRGEYPRAAAHLENALAKTRQRGYLGQNILGQGFDFDIELRRGAGAYICGEETALFASIEGFRGEPRTKPPFPVESGLFGKPTVVNNVETLVAALDIVRDGAAQYASVGTAGSPGTKLFCVSGTIARPGVYEVPFGTSLRALLALAGDVPGGRSVQAILLGGAAGSFVGADQLDLELSFEGARQASATLGSGVVFVLDDSVKLAPLLQRIAAFFRDESCGQCVPCRVGTVRQEELLGRMARGVSLGSPEQERAMFAELSQAMRDASICGLGQTASSAIESALKLFQPFSRKNP